METMLTPDALLEAMLTPDAYALFRDYVNSGGLVKHRETLKNKLVKNRLKGEVTLRCLLDQIFRGTEDSLTEMLSPS
jgi:hypothetical protein